MMVNKLNEVHVLLNEVKWDILGITETHQKTSLGERRLHAARPPPTGFRGTSKSNTFASFLRKYEITS